MWLEGRGIEAGGACLETGHMTGYMMVVKVVGSDIIENEGIEGTSQVFPPYI